MRILFISDNKIDGYGGGCIENKKHYDALKEYCKQNHDELKVISTDYNFKDALIIKLKKNKFRDIFCRILGHSSFFYFTIIENKRALKDYNPDLIYLGRSRFGFIARFFKRINPNCKIITNVDNVEFDYVDAYFSDGNGFLRKVLKKIEKRAVINDEKETIKYSDKLIYLTPRNVDRYRNLYEVLEDNPTVIPICLEKETKLEIDSSKKTVIFIGSLDYQPNFIAANNILESIWKKSFQYKEDIQLIIAGRNPNKYLKEKVSLFNNVRLIENFKSPKDIIPIGSLMIAPIEKGTGMKVKVADALSMGMMVIRLYGDMRG